MMFPRYIWWFCVYGTASLAMQDEEEIDSHKLAPKSTPSHSIRVSLSKDNTGLLGASPTHLLGPGNSPPHIPLKFWANQRKSVVKPRRKDLQETTLIRLLGPDFDSRWMRRTRDQTLSLTGRNGEPEGKTVRALRALVSQNRSYDDSVQLPDNLPDEYKELVKQWLVRRATCPVRFTWVHLGQDFWPRWVKNGQCGSDQGSCSWPPGMTCVPGTAKVLNFLRWHCRLKPHEREKELENSMTPKKGTKEYKKMKNRKRYTCLWVKVPYSVTEECSCSCSKNKL